MHGYGQGNSITHVVSLADKRKSDRNCYTNRCLQFFHSVSNGSDHIQLLNTMDQERPFQDRKFDHICWAEQHLTTAKLSKQNTISA